MCLNKTRHMSDCNSEQGNGVIQAIGGVCENDGDHRKKLPEFGVLFSRLLAHLSSRRRLQLFMLLVLMVLVSFSEVLSISAVLPFLGVLTAPNWVFNHSAAEPLIRALNIAEPGQLILPLTVIFAIAALLAGGLRLTLYWAQARLSYAIGADLGSSIYRRTLYQPYAIHLARHSSEVIGGVYKADSVVTETLLPIFVITSSILMLSAILLTLIAIDPSVAFGVFGGFGVIYAFVIVITRTRVTRYSKLVSQEKTVVLKALQEALGGIRDVILDRTQEIYYQLYKHADQKLRRAESNLVLIGGAPRFIVEALGMVVIAAIACILSQHSEGVVIPVMAALALGAQRMLPVFQSAYSNLSTLRGGQASLSDVLDLLDQTLPECADLVYQDALAFNERIELENISFRYDEKLPFVIKNLSLTIKKGSRVGFIGSTGSGKSTLLDILMGLLSPSAGEFKLDNVEITSQNCHLWQMHIAHVPQVIFLSDSTIEENIAFGVPLDQIDHNRVRYAARQAQIASTIEAWPDQYRTQVGERGVRLSGGQRQRIGIARVLYKEVDVIVFDEATSALDGETERSVMASIESLNPSLTILMVAHRLSTLKGCTEIVELESGAVSRIGSYQDIVESALA